MPITLGSANASDVDVLRSAAPHYWPTEASNVQDLGVKTPSFGSHHLRLVSIRVQHPRGISRVARRQVGNKCVIPLD